MVDSIPQRKLMRRRLFIIQTLSVLAAASGSISTGAISRSFASSIEGHRVLDFDLLDASRQRPVPMRLYLPERASQTHPVPLLTFSHGLGGSRFGYRYLGSHLADAGIASLHPPGWLCVSRRTLKIFASEDMSRKVPSSMKLIPMPRPMPRRYPISKTFPQSSPSRGKRTQTKTRSLFADCCILCSRSVIVMI